MKVGQIFSVFNSASFLSFLFSFLFLSFHMPNMFDVFYCHYWPSTPYSSSPFVISNTIQLFFSHVKSQILSIFKIFLVSDKLMLTITVATFWKLNWEKKNFLVGLAFNAITTLWVPLLLRVLLETNMLKKNYFIFFMYLNWHIDLLNLMKNELSRYINCTITSCP